MDYFNAAGAAGSTSSGQFSSCSVNVALRAGRWHLHGQQHTAATVVSMHLQRVLFTHFIWSVFQQYKRTVFKNKCMRISF